MTKSEVPNISGFSRVEPRKLFLFLKPSDSQTHIVLPLGLPSVTASLFSCPSHSTHRNQIRLIYHYQWLIWTQWLSSLLLVVFIGKTQRSNIFYMYFCTITHFDFFLTIRPCGMIKMSSVLGDVHTSSTVHVPAGIAHCAGRSNVSRMNIVAIRRVALLVLFVPGTEPMYEWS